MFIDPETGKPVSVLHKWIFHSRTMWLNVLGILAELVVEVFPNQTFINLPPVSAFLTAHPSVTFYIAFVVFMGNLYLRKGGGAPLSFTR